MAPTLPRILASNEHTFEYARWPGGDGLLVDLLAPGLAIRDAAVVSDMTKKQQDQFILKNPMWWASVVVSVAFAALGAVLAILRTDSEWWKRAGMGVIALGFAALAWRASRAGVRCAADGVTSTEFNYGRWKDQHFAWSEVDRFEQRGMRGIGARLVSGRWVPLLFFASLGDLSQEKATDLLEQQRRRYQAPQGDSQERPPSSSSNR